MAEGTNNQTIQRKRKKREINAEIGKTPKLISISEDQAGGMKGLATSDYISLLNEAIY